MFRRFSIIVFVCLSIEGLHAQAGNSDLFDPALRLKKWIPSGLKRAYPDEEASCIRDLSALDAWLQAKFPNNGLFQADSKPGQPLDGFVRWFRFAVSQSDAHELSYSGEITLSLQPDIKKVESALANSIGTRSVSPLAGSLSGRPIGELVYHFDNQYSPNAHLVFIRRNAKVELVYKGPNLFFKEGGFKPGPVDLPQLIARAETLAKEIDDWLANPPEEAMTVPAPVPARKKANRPIRR